MLRRKRPSYVKDSDISSVIRILKRECKWFKEPVVTNISRKRDPFRVLISTVISARTKDDVTAKASSQLFAVADTPGKVLTLTVPAVAKLIYPAGFYKTKARHIKQICRILLKKHKGKVPMDLDSLLTLPGVGRKTANLVLGLAYGIRAICVDTHVHRISNRLGYVSAETPQKTEAVLMKKLPKRYWIVYNDLLVTYGQNVCRPVGPKCNQCPIAKYCDYKRRDRD